MTAKINSYFAVLIITLAGAGASLLIIRVATQDTFALVRSDEASYAQLQRSILQQ